MRLTEDPRELDESRLAGLARIGGEALVTRLLTRFQADLSDLMAADALAATGGDPAAWRDAFHRTTGSAGLLGFHRLAELSRALEDASTGVRDLVEDFRAARLSALRIVARRLPGAPSAEVL